MRNGTSHAPATAQTVLVVDDNDATRYATTRIVQGAGYQVLETAGGAEALELVNKASAVVLDVHLPDLHGFEVCRLIRSDPSTASLPIIHLSAVYVSQEDRAAGLTRGADAYMLSPVEPPVLLATLESLIRARGGDRELRRREARFRGLFEQAGIAIALVDSHGAFAEVNEAFAAMVGQQRELLIGQPVCDLAPREDRDEVCRTVTRWVQEPWSGQFSLLKARAAQVRLQWNVSRHTEDGYAVAVATEVQRPRGGRN